ncbi:MAG: hypothetical protein KC502_11205 [Myxococcales bacterium]|nr:hypothetical protein [Myxococcales bacterium]
MTRAYSLPHRRLPHRRLTHRRLTQLLLCAALIAIAPLAHAGPELSVREQVQAATSVIVVRVNLRGRASVVTTESLFGAKVKGQANWLGVCLPDRKLLKRWAKRSSKDRETQRRAEKRGKYSAVVFLSGKGNPICGVEAMTMHHTSASSAFGLFKEAATLAIRAHLHRAPAGKRPQPKKATPRK